MSGVDPITLTIREAVANAFRFRLLAYKRELAVLYITDRALEDELTAEAKSRGLAVEQILREALTIYRSHSPVRPQTPEELDRILDEIADSIPSSRQPLPDESISRESIYTREDELR